MNRREFVKSLGVMAAASFVPFAYAAASKPELEYLTFGNDADEIGKMLELIKRFDNWLIGENFAAIEKCELSWGEIFHISGVSCHEECPIIVNTIGRKGQYVCGACDFMMDWAILDPKRNICIPPYMSFLNIWEVFTEDDFEHDGVVSKFSGIRVRPSSEFHMKDNGYLLDMSVIKPRSQTKWTAWSL